MGDPLPRPSFRDPEGRTVVLEDHVLRFLREGTWEVLHDFEASAAGKHLLEAKAVLPWRRLTQSEIPSPESSSGRLDSLAAESWAAVIAHQRIPFASFPHEWPPEMLEAAGRLILDIAAALLDDDFGLKDATPYNVLFDGPHPVHVDVLSVERRISGDPLWLAESQFTQTILFPLLAYRDFRRPSHGEFLASREGIEPENLYYAAGALRRLAPGFFGMVTLPVWLAGAARRRQAKLYRPRRIDPDRAAFVLRHRLRRLARCLDRLTPPARESVWSDYEDMRDYGAADIAAKDEFVRAALRRFAPATVLDIGCNTGRYSLMAAENGARVVAIDADPVVVGRTWREALRRGADILPLVVDVARPTPAIGWRNGECPSFLARAGGRFKAVFALALLHHLMVTERIPLAEVMALLAKLTTGIAVVEFVAPDDPNFIRLCRGREALYGDLTEAAFVDACRDRFTIVERQPLQSGTRTLFLLMSKPPDRDPAVAATG